MDMDKLDTTTVSLRDTGEAQTVLEDQRFGTVTQPPTALASQDTVTSKDVRLENNQTEEKSQKRLSQSEDEIAEEEVEEEVEEEEEEVEEEEEDKAEEEEEEELEQEEEEEEEEEEEKQEVMNKVTEKVKWEQEKESDNSQNSKKELLAEACALTSPTDETKEIEENQRIKETESKYDSEQVLLSEMADTDEPDNARKTLSKSPEHPEKPVIPPQTYLWKEVEKSKEQGGYPWTHLYKEPLGPGDEPEVILRYSHSPVNRRRKVEEQLIDGSSRAEKKAKTDDDVIAETVEVQQTVESESPPQETPSSPETETVTTATAETSNEQPESPRRSRARAASQEPLGIKSEFKAQAKQFLEEHPTIKNFSNSLTRKGKRTRTFVSRSLERAKSLADKQLDKAKIQMNTLRRRKAASEPPRDLPEHKILILRESPRFGNREIPAYVVRQPSDEEMDTSVVENGQVKSEETVVETTTIIPDEIIELPTQQTSEPIQQPEEHPKETSKPEKMEVEEERYEIIGPPKEDEAIATETIQEVVTSPVIQQEVKAQPPQKAPRKKKEHHYEDIDDYIRPQEEAAEIKPTVEAKLMRQHEIDSLDPIIGEILGNDKIKISLQLQDEQIANDLISRRKRLDEILQHSSEDEKEKDKIPSLGLLAPISSIDSTSSDEEARKTHLSALAEESDTGSVDNVTTKQQDTIEDNALSALAATDKQPCSTEQKQQEDAYKIVAKVAATDENIQVKQFELTPAEERMLNEAEGMTILTQVEEKILNTEAPVFEKVSMPIVETKKVTDERWSKMSDHEYEPIGEPVDKAVVSKPATATVTLAPPSDDQKRKMSTASLRVPGDEADTISMEELQRNIEDRYFNRPADEETTEEATEPAEAVQEKTSKVKAAMARAQESGKKGMAWAQESSKHAMVKAQQGGKSLHQKLRKQTDRFKTKMSNINVKKDKDIAPLASPEIVTTPEIENLDFTLAVPKTEQETGETEPATATTEEISPEPTTEDAERAKKKFKAPEFAKLKNIHMPKMQKPEFKRPEFTKITKPKIPKIRAPDMSKFRRPEMPKFLTEKPDFSKLKMPEKIGAIKIQRSKSMKETSPSGATSATSPSDAETPSLTGADGAKSKVDYTDFSTFPRFLDKFKRQKTVPSNASVRAATPPPLEFTKAGKTSRPKGPTIISRWAEKSSEDTGSTRFFSGSELGEREGSVERRMRQRLETAEFDAPEPAVTAEQKQLEEYDKENREIHLLSAARHDEFLKRKPPMERQESDLASEEEKQFWASSLGQKIRQNIDMNSNDFDFLDDEERLRTAGENETMGLSERDRARFLGEPTEQSEKDYDMRSTTPYSNKECQSSGSSGVRRRKGVLEEIDDDEFFLRQKGISKDNIQMGEYISSAIKEGLSTPKNALAEMGRYEAYYDEDMDASERMSMEYRGERGAGGLRYYQPSVESDDLSNKQSFTDEFRRNADFFKTFPPDRPSRKHKKPLDEEHFNDDQQRVPYDSFQQEDDEAEFYHPERKYGSEQPEIGIAKDERYIDEESVGNGFSQTGAAVPPTPPRRRKKRFRDVTPSGLEPFGNGLTAKPIYNSFTIGPETHLFRAEVPLAQEESFTTPLPTPRISRSRSQLSRGFEDDRVSRGAESYTFGADDRFTVKHIVDMSESNGYAIVRKEPPPRPPAPVRRRKSTRSLGDQHQFSTLPNYQSLSPVRPSRNYSTICPSRPPRGRSSTSLNDGQGRPSRISKEDITQYEEIESVENEPKFHQTLQSGAIVSKMKDRPLPPPPRPPRESRKPRKPDPDDKHDFDGGAERFTVVQMTGPRVVEEVEIAIQTDPVSEDYELDIEVSETFGSGGTAERPTKTLQEILKEEQQAELDRARQLAEASNLMRDIQKFRDSTSSLSLHGSRPETPAAISIERRVSTPTASGIREDRIPSMGISIRPISSDNLTEQDLANADDDKYIAELVNKYVSEEKVSESGKRPQKAKTQIVIAPSEVDSSKLQEIESMIVREEIKREEARTVQSEPAAPPRRRSLVASNQDLARSVEIPSNVIEEIVERLRTNEQQHIAELQQLHLQQLEDVQKQQEEQKRSQEQKLEEQQKQLLEQQNQQLHETQQLKEQILQQQEQQKALLQQQQQQQQQLLLAQQQQQLLLQQQDKERELQRERERELLREREIELEKARERERELHHARELELQRARELEQQRAREIEQQRLRELELQRAMELEHQRLRELEMQRAQEAELQRAREAELQRAREAELQRARETEIQRIREAEMQRAREIEMLRAREIEHRIKETEHKEGTTEGPTESPEPTSKEEAVEFVTIISETGELMQEATLEAPKEPTPARPPPPRISPQIPLASQFPYQEYLPYALPPQPFYPVRNYSDDEAALPQAPHRRRRHHRSRRDSTSEEEYQREQRKQRHGTRSPEPSIPALGSQLIRACGSSLRQTGDELMSILRASSKDENKRDLHIALIILIVIVAGLMALGMSGEKAVHHHHWDYFTPPGNSGNA